MTDPLGPHSTLPDVCFETDLAGLRLQQLRLQLAGRLPMGQPPTVFSTQEEAYEEALNRLQTLCGAPHRVWRVARRIRIDQRLPEGDILRVTLHDRDGRVLFQGEVA